MVRNQERLAPLLRQLVSDLEKHASYASAFVTRSRELRVTSSSREERVSEIGPAVGAVFTAWDGVCLREVATGDLSPDELAAAAKGLAVCLSSDSRSDSRSGPSGQGAPPSGGAGLPAGLLEVPVTPAGAVFYKTPQEIDVETVSLEEKLDLCRKGKDRAASLDRRIVEAGCSYSEERVRSLFVNRSSEMAQEISRVGFGFHNVFSEGGVVRSDGETNGGTGGFELATLAESQWEDAASRIPGLLKATPVEPGYYDVVVSPAAAGLIAHEAFGHGVETDMFLKGRAKAREYLGKAVGSPLVDLFDDPTYPGGYGTHGFDDEGQPASRTQILRNGVFAQGLTDLHSAMRLGIPHTSNGRRDGVNKAYPRMTNTFFGVGSDRLEDMIASIDQGFYLGWISSGMEDPKDWGVQCILAWGRAIERGKLTDRFHTQIGLTGYVPDLLGSISMVGRDIRIYGGHCGKGYKEMVRVGMGGPHLKMKARLG